MENSLLENILSVCGMLDKHSVEYLVVGGTAVALHGYFRLSHKSSGDLTEKHDIDIWYNPTYKNYFNLLAALEALGQDVNRYKKEKAPDPKKSFFSLEYDRFTLDFLPELPGLPKFRSSFEKRDISRVDEIEIPIINYDDLITNKETQARLKDLEDIKQLKLRRNNPE